jgi:hypothetical protein
MMTALALVALAARCPVPQDKPVAFVRTALQGGKDPQTPPERLIQVVDWESLAQALLRDAWAAQSEDHRARFVAVLKQRMARHLHRRVDRDVHWEVTELTAKGPLGVDGRVRVRRGAKADTYRLSVDLARSPAGCLGVVDVTADDVSMQRNLRARVRRLLDEKGWDTMMERMSAPEPD